jgi:NADPH2:quinone reductase
VQGRYQVKPPFPFIPGGEIAGVVREIGRDVSGFAVGDRVLAAAPWVAAARTRPRRSRTACPTR